MNNAGHRKPAIHQPMHTLPVRAAFAGCVAEATYANVESPLDERHQAPRCWSGRLIRVVSAQYGTQPLALRGDRFVPPTLQLTGDLVNLRDQPRAHRMTL